MNWEINVKLVLHRDFPKLHWSRVRGRRKEEQRVLRTGTKNNIQLLNFLHGEERRVEGEILIIRILDKNLEFFIFPCKKKIKT